MTAVKLEDARRVISAAEKKARESGGFGDQDHAVNVVGAAAF